jgi:hypothetical protein
MEDDNGAYGLGHPGDSLPHADDARAEAGSQAGDDELLSQEQVSSLRGLLDYLSQEDDAPVAAAEPELEASLLDAADSLPEPGLPERGDLPEADGLPEVAGLPEDIDLAGAVWPPEDIDLPADAGFPGDGDGDGLVEDQGNGPADLDEYSWPAESPSATAAAPSAATAREPSAAIPREPVRLATVPRPETGEARVDAALSLLDDLTELPVAEHPAVFERVHAQLSEVLGELGSGSLTGPPGRDGG